jgi:hypothetical protein
MNSEDTVTFKEILKAVLKELEAGISILMINNDIKEFSKHMKEAKKLMDWIENIIEVIEKKGTENE